jgi:RNA polymerase sigma-70 factor (ECF subfamily)
LPEDLRVAIVLYDIEGQSYQEVARVLEIPEGTVKSRIHRARKALRDLLASDIHPNAEGAAS